MESQYKKKLLVKHKPRPFKKIMEEQKYGKPMDIDNQIDNQIDNSMNIDNPINNI